MTPFLPLYNTKYSTVPMGSPAPKTCPRCSEFETRLGQSPNDSSIELHPDIWALQRAANDGCPLCQLVYHAVLFEEPGILQYEDLSGKKVCLDFFYYGRDSSDDGEGVSPDRDEASNLVLRARIDPYTRSVMEFQQRGLTNPEAPTSRFPSGCAPHAVDFGSAQGVEVIAAKGREWLSACRGSHQNCKDADWDRRGRKRTDGPIVPTRLVDVGLEGEELSPKLVITGGSPNYQEYASLSYVWGERNLGMHTTSSNVQHLTDRIDVSQLSRTIQDAITVTRKLGIRYLWVDSLCILQRQGPDDPVHVSDWRREAARFGDYYSNPVVTISATGARSSSDGLFLDRPGRAISPQPHTIQRVNYSGELTEITIHPPIPRWLLEMRNPPLSKRGWAAQERLMSPRILHFAGNCVCWECCELEATELYPKEFDLEEAHPSAPHKLEKRLRGGLTDLPVEATREMWYEYIATYSGKQFTLVSDRLPALSALAARVHARTKDVYLHGLWEETLVSGLAWAVHSRRWVPAGSRVLSVPTWSWATGRGSVEFMHRFGDWVSLAKVDSKVGRAKGAVGFHDFEEAPVHQLRATGRMMTTNSEALQLKESYKYNDVETNVLEHVSDPRSWNFHHSLHLDTMDTKDFSPDREFHCFLLGRLETYNRGRPRPWLVPIGVALALEPTGKTSDGVDEFRRIGLLTIHYTKYWADVVDERVITLV
ncbi:Heterokaryon incompatibility protein (HET) domain containing protein [Rhypophila decipiens]